MPMNCSAMMIRLPVCRISRILPWPAKTPMMTSAAAAMPLWTTQQKVCRFRAMETAAMFSALMRQNTAVITVCASV